MSLKNVVKMGVLGDKHIIKTVKDEDGTAFWIIPKKFTVSERDDIALAEKKMQEGVNKKSLVQLLSKKEEFQDKPLNDVIDQLSDQEVSTLMDQSGMPKTEYFTKIIKAGIASSNLEAGHEHDSFSGVSDEMIDLILTYPDLTDEIVQIIQEINGPLARTTGSTSGTQPSGATKQQSTK